MNLLCIPKNIFLSNFSETKPKGKTKIKNQSNDEFKLSLTQTPLLDFIKLLTWLLWGSLVLDVTQIQCIWVG